MNLEIIIEDQSELAECPRWDEVNQLLYWVDILKCELHCFAPDTQQHQVRKFDEVIACVSLCKQGGFILALQSGLYLLNDLTSEDLVFLGNPEPDKPHNRLNDGRCDDAGNFWVGSMSSHTGDGHLYKLSSEGTITYQAGNVTTSNGLAFSLDQNTVYYSDSRSRTIYCFEYDGQNLSHGRVFYQFEQLDEKPDGACIDSEGYYWSALFGASKVVRISPSGIIDHEIMIPAKNCTMVAFGRKNLQTLYVTTACHKLSQQERLDNPLNGAIFSIELDIAGLIEPRFHCQFEPEVKLSK